MTVHWCRIFCEKRIDKKVEFVCNNRNALIVECSHFDSVTIVTKMWLSFKTKIFSLIKMTKLNMIFQICLFLLLKFESAHANYNKYYLDDSNFCRKNLNTVPIGDQSYKSTIIISAVPSSNSYRSSLKCSVAVRAPPNYGIIINKRMVYY